MLGAILMLAASATAYSNCPWKQSTGMDYVFRCVDGSTCNGQLQGANCCKYKGGRLQCPRDAPIMCNSKTCAGGDYCCASQSCYEYGGERPCGSGNVVYSEPTLGSMQLSPEHQAAMGNVKQQAGAAVTKAQSGWQNWQTAHPNWQQTAQTRMADWNTAHPNARSQFQAGMGQVRTGFQNYQTAHPEFQQNLQKGWQTAAKDFQTWETAHPDASVEDLIDAIVAYMTPERQAKAKALLQSVVDMLMEVEGKVESKMHSMQHATTTAAATPVGK